MKKRTIVLICVAAVIIPLLMILVLVAIMFVFPLVLYKGAIDVAVNSEDEMISTYNSVFEIFCGEDRIGEHVEYLIDDLIIKENSDGDDKKILVRFDSDNVYIPYTSEIYELEEMIDYISENKRYDVEQEYDSEGRIYKVSVKEN